MLHLLISIVALAFSAETRAGELLLYPTGHSLRGTQARVFPDPTVLRDCLAEIDDFSRQALKQEVDVKCFATVRLAADLRALTSDPRLRTIAAGYQGVLFLETRNCEPGSYQPTPGTCYRIIAGNQTGLKHVTAVSVSEGYGEILVLQDQPWSVLTFRIGHGNFAPLRRIEAPGLRGATDIAAYAERDEVWVANPARGSVLVYSRKSNSASKREAQAVTVLRELKGPKTGLKAPYAIAIDRFHQEIFVADREQNRILVFGATDEGDTPPRRIIEGPATGLAAPVRVGYQFENELIQVGDEQGNVRRFNRTANGNVSPVATP